MTGTDVSAVTERRQASGLRCLSLLLGFLHIPTDTEQLRHAAGAGEIDAATLVRLARRLGARANRRTLSIERLDQVPLPIIARDIDGSFFVIASMRDRMVLVQPASGWLAIMTPEELNARWTGEAVLVTTRSDGRAGGKFDVTWFIPALVRYRGLIGEVLAASLVLQLFALATPLIFQVVIDKVLVHKGLTTLNVLAIGLVAVILFEALLGGLRAYLFARTRPIAWTWSSAPSSTATCLRCPCPISRRVAWEIPSRACGNSTPSASS